MYRPGEQVRCDWCQMVAKEGEYQVIDKLHLHDKPVFKQVKSCVELYRNYCRWIKERGV